ncbi:MAG: hypothetical protein KC621_14630 [Myxococcales bacterium]|nr:hypothetical protein [Myxococcales bacterium]
MRVTARMVSSRDRGAPAALGLTLASTVFVASYAGQRLWSALRGEPDWTEIIVSAHTPYYWRCGVALLQGGLVGLAAGLGTSTELAATVLRFAPVWVPAVVLPMALAMAAVP